MNDILLVIKPCRRGLRPNLNEILLVSEPVASPVGVDLVQNWTHVLSMWVPYTHTALALCTTASGVSFSAGLTEVSTSLLRCKSLAPLL